MHSDTVMRAIDRREQSNHFECALLTHPVKRPRAVFSATPSQPCFHPSLGPRCFCMKLSACQAIRSDRFRPPKGICFAEISANLSASALSLSCLFSFPGRDYRSATRLKSTETSGPSGGSITTVVELEVKSFAGSSIRKVAPVSTQPPPSRLQP